ncbi:F0F1 ATP synthase subunit epsilon [Salinisphaera sp. SPP-AMP-43]|uniref:F0F1 ATP synthase subunit epsilon n=1 Tax=Salinisphaera sp. SPP-AMP-43 TaxID=3121288 RepID=UPI003C6E84EC
MHLRILLPFAVFVDRQHVQRIVVATTAGAYGFWPHRLDCVAALVPGILTYASEADGEVPIAVDEGALVKTGPEVWVSVRRAVGGVALEALQAAVEQQFLQLDEQQRAARAAMARMEAGLVRRIAEFDRGR